MYCSLRGTFGFTNSRLCRLFQEHFFFKKEHELHSRFQCGSRWRNAYSRQLWERSNIAEMWLHGVQSDRSPGGRNQVKVSDQVGLKDLAN